MLRHGNRHGRRRCERHTPDPRHAVAALAYGTRSVPRVDRIVGPGNRWVSAAKSIVSGDCGIDFYAGPTEILIVVEDGTDSHIADGVVHYEDAMAEGSEERDFGPRAEDDLYILYTGGTTGMPKGVMWRVEDVFYALGGGIDAIVDSVPTCIQLRATADMDSERLIFGRNFKAVLPRGGHGQVVGLGSFSLGSLKCFKVGSADLDHLRLIVCQARLTIC